MYNRAELLSSSTSATTFIRPLSIQVNCHLPVDSQSKLLLILNVVFIIYHYVRWCINLKFKWRESGLEFFGSGGEKKKRRSRSRKRTK